MYVTVVSDGNYNTVPTKPLLHRANKNLFRVCTHCGEAHFVQRPLIYLFIVPTRTERQDLSGQTLPKYLHNQE